MTWYVGLPQHAALHPAHVVLLQQPTQLILQNDQAAINGIRSAGALQLILAPGNGYTGGHSWTQITGAANNAPSSEYLNKLVDPIKNTAMDIHEVCGLEKISP